MLEQNTLQNAIAATHLHQDLVQLLRPTAPCHAVETQQKHVVDQTD